MKLAIVGEAWGQNEAELSPPHPFVGTSGMELGRLLFESGIVRNPIPDTYSGPGGELRRRFVQPRDMAFWWSTTGILTTNVLNFRPPENKLESILVPKEASLPGYPALKQAAYFPLTFQPELDRLYSELRAAKPNLILALGNAACIALLRQAKITKIRGTTFWSDFGKILPSYHPSYILRNWEDRPVLLADLIKARREMEFPEIRRPERLVLVRPTFQELLDWHTTLQDCKYLACDIETAFGQISMIGFAPNAGHAIVIPFHDATKSGWSYWETPALEKAARSVVQSLLGSSVKKIFQNGLFDLQYLLRAGYHPRNVTDDTMLLHHSLYPELQKGLGFLGSIYTDESSWKMMRTQQEEMKRDE